MKLTSVPPKKDSTPTEPNPKVVAIKGEIVSLLEDKLEELRRESEKVHTTMEQVLYRIRTQGFEAKLDDLRSGRWYALKAHVQALQEVVEIFDSHE